MQYSLEVGTKWYKAPEIIYGSREYTEKVDMWSLGTILAELLDHTPIFTGATDLDQLSKISKFLGPPTNLPKEAQWFAVNSEQAEVVDWDQFFAHRTCDGENELGVQAVDLVKKLIIYEV